MKTETAKQAAELIDKINKAEDKLKYLNMIKKIHHIRIVGEDEDLKEYHVLFHSDDNKVFIAHIHGIFRQYFIDEVNELNDKLRQL